MQPIYGHTSQATAFMIDDYPYGRTLRCRRRVWLESHPTRGFRFVSQTEHPTKKVWNKPHTSTYIEIAAGLYLDEQGHVAWTGVGSYTEPAKALEFVQTFGAKCEGASRLIDWASKKAIIASKFASGQLFMTMNGIRQERSEDQKSDDRKESETWGKVAAMLREGSA